MKCKKLLCFGMAAALACSSMQAGTSRAGSIPERELENGTLQVQEGAKAASGNEYETKNGWSYKGLKNGTVEITGYTGKKTSITIPSKIGGKKVSSIGKAAFGYSNCAVSDKIISIKLPATVKRIDENAFAYCSSLKSIKIPKGVTTIGDGAFYFCESLTSISLPDTVKSVGSRAFWCTSLKSLTIPKSLAKIGNGAFSYIFNLKVIKVQKGNTAYCAQDGILFTKDMKTLVACPMEKEGSYTVPKSVRKIAESAFYGSLLKDIKFQKGLTTIGKYAFSYAQPKSFVFQEGLKTIEEGAFSLCYQLESVTIPKSVKKITENEFSGCTKLKLKVVRGSYGAKWAKKHSIPYSYTK